MWPKRSRHRPPERAGLRDGPSVFERHFLHTVTPEQVRRDGSVRNGLASKLSVDPFYTPVLAVCPNRIFFASSLIGFCSDTAAPAA